MLASSGVMTITRPFYSFSMPSAQAKPSILEIMDALDKFIREKPAGRLYHYTGAAGLIGIVRSRTLWATDYPPLK